MGLIDRKEKIPPMRSKEELNALKEEVETLNKKLAELTEEELAQVFGGGFKTYHTYMECTNCGANIVEYGDLVGQTINCRNCEQNTMLGIRIVDPF